LTTLPLAACAGSGSGLKEVIRRDLPAAPAYLQPVAVLEPRAGENTLSVAARERAGRLKANTIIRNARRQWESLRASYRASK
jgi:hypothetical protein